MSCVWMLQRGHSGNGCVLALTLCYLRKGDLFVLSWARMRRVRCGIISSESKSTRVFTCHSCVKSMYPSFPKNYNYESSQPVFIPYKIHYPSDPFSSILSSIYPAHPYSPHSFSSIQFLPSNFTTPAHLPHPS